MTDQPHNLSQKRRSSALKSWANTEDRAARTQAARDAQTARYERLVDPDGKMTPEARRKAADAALRAHMIDMSIKSAEARRRRKAAAEFRARREVNREKVRAAERQRRAAER